MKFLHCVKSYGNRAFLKRQLLPATGRIISGNSMTFRYWIFEKWINNYVTNWASCDTFCNHTVGTLVEMYPENINILKNGQNPETLDEKGFSSFTDCSCKERALSERYISKLPTYLLTDSDDMVQKGYGWMLKAASQAQQKEVFDYVMRNKAMMPRTSLRYAIEKMPDDLKIAWLWQNNYSGLLTLH